jgi:hypothetical protein
MIHLLYALIINQAAAGDVWRGYGGAVVYEEGSARNTRVYSVTCDLVTSGRT